MPTNSIRTNTMNRTSVVLPCAILASSLTAFLGCGSDESKTTGTTSTTGTTTGTGTSTATTTCNEVSLFAPLALGTPENGGGQDLIREIQVDDGSGDIYFSGYSELFRLPAGSSAPSKVMDRPEAGDEFWLRPNRILFPAGLAFSLVQNSPGVLYATSRTGGDLSTIVPIEPAVPDPILWNVTVSSVAVQGDDVYWVDERGEVAITATDTKFTYTLYKKPWAEAGTAPVRLYQGSRALDSVFAAGNDVYFEEWGDTLSSADKRQLRVGAGANGGPPEDVSAIVKGEVLAGDEESVLVSRSDFEAGSYGVFSMRPDGSNEVKLDDTFLLNEYVSRNGVWGIVAYAGLSDNIPVYTYSTKTGRRSLGCINAANTTVHAAALTSSALYVSIYRQQKTTILSFPL